jgi:hypothetical protein
VRRLFIYLFFHFIANAIVQGQSIQKPLAAPIARLLTYSSLHSNPFNIGDNQATLAKINNISGAIYGEKRFALKELSLYTAALSIPTSSGNFGIKADHFGDLSYNESAVGLAYGRRLGEKLDIGVQFNYYNFKTQGYGSASSINAEGGILYHLTESLNIGFHMYNPGGSQLGKSGEEYLPSIYSAGFGYNVSPKLYIGASIEKQEHEPLNVVGGLHYYFDNKLSACGGIGSATSTYYIGFGVLVKGLQLNVLAAMHPQLGVTPGLLLIFNPPVKAQLNNE